jgi:hypothetical protein|tara:strand:- start:129 stop:698 length:570 start_codon:yes stop_codon:yes gene_type:complete
MPVKLNPTDAVPIWSGPLREPKRKFKFVLNLNGIATYTIKTTNRPQISIGEAKHEFLVHDFYFPGRVTWNEISITLVDPIDQNNSKRLLDFIKNGGYVNPSDFDPVPGGDNYQRKSLSKAAMVDGLGEITIDTLDSKGSVIETWTLKNPWIKSVSYADMAYSDEGLVELTMALRYDWAVLTSTVDTGAT